MKKGGKGGANTNASGLAFEGKVSLSELLIKEGFCIRKTEHGDTLFDKNEKLIGVLLPKYEIYRYLFKKGIILDREAKDVLSKRLLPDNAFFNFTNKVIYIIEVKFQGASGSTDEKIQTCDYKRKRYVKLFGEHVQKVEFIYILSEWFERPEYKDTLGYIEEVGCHYYFKQLPLESLGL